MGWISMFLTYDAEKKSWKNMQQSSPKKMLISTRDLALFGWENYSINSFSIYIKIKRNKP